MSNAQRLLWLPLAAVVGVVLLCLGCTRTPLAGNSATVAALLADGRTVELHWEDTADGAPTVDREHAVAAARSGVAPTATADGRLVLLTVRALDSGALALDRGKVWLVTFPEVAFVAGEACACEGSPTRSKTVVAVDASDGAVLASFGVAD